MDTREIQRIADIVQNRVKEIVDPLVRTEVERRVEEFRRNLQDDVVREIARVVKEQVEAHVCVTVETKGVHS